MHPDYPNQPLILALETASPVSSVAVFAGEKLLGGMEFHTDKLHAKLLTVMIQQVMDGLSLKMESLDAVGMSSGPGSYTGLRVGVSVAKGLCFALDKPLLAIDSLESLAWSVADFASATGAWICPMLDARRMEVYSACYDSELQVIQPVQAQIVEQGAFEAFLDQRKLIFLGDGAAKCREIITHPHAIFLPERLSSAFSMGKGLMKRFREGKFEDLTLFEPFYLKDFVATQSKKKLF